MFNSPDGWVLNIISQSTAEIKLLPVSEIGRPPYSNSISGFDFDLYTVIGMSFCTCLPNFVVIGPTIPSELSRHIELSRCGHKVIKWLYDTGKEALACARKIYLSIRLRHLRSLYANCLPSKFPYLIFHNALVLGNPREYRNK